MNRIICLAAIAAAVSCVPSTFNQPCQLKLSDGGLMTEAQAQALNAAGKDIVFIGSAECDKLICVREAAFKSTAEGSSPASGYCSQECTASNAQSCSEGGAKLTCRTVESRSGQLCVR